VLAYLKWTFWIVFWVILLAFLHYTLPRWDVVRIADTYEKRETFGANSIFWSHANTGQGTGGDISRDVFFIQTIKPNDRIVVYRNEDTGWGWPPYFKFDTTNLQTRATDLRSTPSNPDWVAIKRYGWRSEFLTIFPNALRIKDVEGPDSRVIPWTSIGILVGLACLFWAIWARWRRFWANRVDPLLDDEV
jgi:hypothetical protein